MKYSYCLKSGGMVCKVSANESFSPTTHNCHKDTGVKHCHEGTISASPWKCHSFRRTGHLEVLNTSRWWVAGGTSNTRRDKTVTKGNGTKNRNRCIWKTLNQKQPLTAIPRNRNAPSISCPRWQLDRREILDTILNFGTVINLCIQVYAKPHLSAFVQKK